MCEYECEDGQNGAHHSEPRYENVLPREAVVNGNDHLKMNANVDHHRKKYATGYQRQGWAMKGKLNDYANGHAHDRVHHAHVHVHANGPV